MALYKPESGYPAIDPLAPCTVSTPGQGPGIRAGVGSQPATARSDMPETHNPVPPITEGAERRHLPQAQGPAPAPVVFHRGASQLTNPRLVLIFDAALLNDSAGAPGAGYLPWHLYHCLSALVSGPFAAGLQQYGAGPGAYAGYAALRFPTGTVTTDALAGWLTQAVLRQAQDERSGQIGSSGDQTLYMLFPGPNTVLGEPGFQYGVDFCAYHTVLPPAGGVGGRVSGVIPYAVMPFPTASGCTLFGALPTLDALTMTASHELAEAMTDTVPGQGETGPQGEIDDFAPCLWSPVPITVDDFSYRIQAYWSEADQRCWQAAALPSVAQAVLRQAQDERSRQIGSRASVPRSPGSGMPDPGEPEPVVSPQPPSLALVHAGVMNHVPTQEQVLDLIERVAALEEAHDPAHAELIRRFTSRKFLLTAAAIVALLAGPLRQVIPPADAAIAVTTLTAIYTVVEGVVDTARQ